MPTAHKLSYRFFGAISDIRRSLLILITASSITACTSWLPDAHRLEITQGNAITPEQVSQLSVGMPKAEVRAMLGVPVLQDPFHNQRWDYIFRYLPSNEDPRQSRLTLHFEEDILIRVDDSEYKDPETITPPPILLD